MEPSAEQLVGHLDRGETDEVRRSHHQGELAWLAPLLGPLLYKELGARADRGDVAGIRALLVQAGVTPAPGPGDPTATGEDDGRRGVFGWIGLLVIVAVLALAAVGLARCSDDDSSRTVGSGAGAPTLVELVEREGELSTFGALLARSGLSAQLTGDGPFTVFAPDDEAFAALPAGVRDAVDEAEPDTIAELLRSHVVATDLPGADLVAGELTSLSGRTLDVDIDAGDEPPTVTVGGAEVVRPDLRTDNGVVHVLNAVAIDPDDVEALLG